jgi:autophagy-related protein 2
VDVELSRILIACAAVNECVVTSIISIGSLGLGSHLELGVPLPVVLKPRITIKNLKPPSKQDAPVIVLGVDIPSVHVDVSKHVVNVLQYWVDDATQLVDRTFGGDSDGTSTERATSRDASLIGSRFFVKSRSGSGTSSALNASASNSRSETSVKISVSEGI